MGEKLVYVALDSNVSDSYDWPDLAQFNAGGIPEKSGVLSIDELDRAEDSLQSISGSVEAEEIKHSAEILHLFRAHHGDGHAIESQHHDIVAAHLKHGHSRNNDHNHTIFNYSLKDTASEQDGAKYSDANVAISSGYLKRGILDPDAYVIHQNKKHTYFYLSQILRYQDLLNQYLMELDARIKELEEEIKAHDEKIAQMDEVLDILDDGDINANSAAGRMRRVKLQDWAKERGIDLDKFKKEDGSIDQNKLRDYIIARQQSVIDKREAAREELEERIAEYKETQNRLEAVTQEKHTILTKTKLSGDEEQIKQNQSAPKDSGTRGQLDHQQQPAQSDIDTYYSTAMMEGFDLNNAFDRLFTNNGDIKSTVSPAQSASNCAIYGSFSGSVFDNVENITNNFNVKSTGVSLSANPASHDVSTDNEHEYVRNGAPVNSYAI